MGSAMEWGWCGPLKPFEEAEEEVLWCSFVVSSPPGGGGGGGEGEGSGLLEGWGVADRRGEDSRLGRES